MADIHEKIYSKYNIDIDKENIINLYKIEKPDLTSQELEELIFQTRKRWNQSLNGVNEKNIERDKARLEKADHFEKILKDKKLRKALYNYYIKGKTTSQKSASSEGVEFAKEYFNVINSSKNIKKNDVEFFFEYFQSQRKNKKEILEILKNEFNIKFLGNKKTNELEEDEQPLEEDEKPLEGKTKEESKNIIVNLFQEATIHKIKKSVDYYEMAIKSDLVIKKYPLLKEGIYEFLELNKFESIDEISQYVTLKSKEVYEVRQERGIDFVPLVDMLNLYKELLLYNDVVDNLLEFKLLIKYPNLTPYMYSFVSMKPKTLKCFMEIVNREGTFRDETDFILNYYNHIYDNFGITNSGISHIIKKAEKKAKANKIANKVDEALGLKKKRKMSIWANIIHLLVYWPIFLIYFVFEIFKAIFTELHRLTIPMFLILVVLSNIIYPQIVDLNNLLYLRNIFNKKVWYEHINEFLDISINSGLQAFLLSLVVIIIYLLIYAVPPFFIALIIAVAAEDLNKKYDWIGHERTFQSRFQRLRKRAEDNYLAHKKIYYKKRVPKVIINLILTIFLIIIFSIIQKEIEKLGGFKAFIDNSGYFQEDDSLDKYKSDKLKEKEDNEWPYLSNY